MSGVTILLHSKFMSAKQLGVIKNVLHRNGFDKNRIFPLSLESHTGDGSVVYKGNGTFYWKHDKADQAKRTLRDILHRIRATSVICTDNASLNLLVGQKSRDTCRGSIYHINSIPMLVLNDIFGLFSDKTAPFFIGADLLKLKRWITNGTRSESRFNLKICSTVNELAECLTRHTGSLFSSVDVETSKVGITSISFTCLEHDGFLSTWVIPFVSPLTPDGNYWATQEEEMTAWGVVKDICENDKIYKIFQGGVYDCAWIMKMRIAVKAFYFDTMHMWRCIWAELPMGIDTISSVCVDTHRYWKDDIKGDTEKNKQTGKKEPKTRIPKSPSGYAMYLRYNGLDTHQTALSFLFLLRLYKNPEYNWAVFNYCKKEWPLETGPNFAMSMRGLLVNQERQAWFNRKWHGDSASALSKLRKMTADDQFNPNSPIQIQWLLFKVFGAKMPALRGKYAKKDKKTGLTKLSTDEKILKFIRLQHPILARVIDTVWAVKKPLNNASKYGTMPLLGGRFMYRLSVRTECNRDAGSNHSFWYGTNPQNIPVKARSMFVADEGRFIWNSDYSQADAYFVAFFSEDPNYIRNILSPEDTHCLHTEFFFGEPYDKVYKSYKAKEAWAVDPITGVRQNSKKITHGAGYQMQGGTLYVTMGHEAIVATAKAMGNLDAHIWTAARCQQFAETLVQKFLNQLYPGLPKWFKRTCEEAIRNRNKVVAYGGRTRYFFGDLAKDDAVKREISAYYGQGGTAEKVNDTLLKVWDTDLEIAKNPIGYNDFALHLQVHDSVVGQCITHQRGLDKLDQFLTIMKAPVTILGRTFEIPVESEIGFSWEGASVGYKPGMRFAEVYDKVRAAEDKLNAKFAST